MTPRRQYAFILAIVFRLGICAASPLLAENEFIMTNATQVRALTTAQAQQHLPAHLRGVVLGEAEPDGKAFVIWDKTAAIYLLGPTNLVSQIHRGDLVEVEGVSDPGEFAPILLVDKLQKLGAGEIPKPRAITSEQLVTSDLDCQWVEISGIVRDCEPLPWDTWKSKMELATGGDRLTIQINNRHAPGAYVDAEVRLQGICFYEYNKNRQLLRPLLLMPRGVPVIVDKPMPNDLYATPPCPINKLLQFAPQGLYGHQVHVRGIVTYYNKTNTLWIRDAGGGLRIQTHQTYPLQPGDVVDVLGFPSHGTYSPMLEDAVFRKVASGFPPAPRQITNAVSALNYDSELLQLNGEVVNVRQVFDGWALTIRNGNLSFDALLHVLPIPISLLQQWKPGSHLKLTGICLVNVENPELVSGIVEPHSFQLLLRSENDVAVVQPAPWWDWEKIAWTLSSLLCALLLVIAVIILLSRRRLREQAAQRTRAETEFLAVLKERNRAAREIHDTLAQGLGAISIQLELAKDHLPPNSNDVMKHLGIAHTLVRSSLADTRNSIWNMRSQVLETGDLATALDGILQQLTDGTDVKFQFQAPKKSNRLPPIIENDILRIGQEAITNAVKHAQAKNIFVALEYINKTVRLRVRDDGKGFDVKNPPPSSGGFGLIGMRERGKHLQGRLTIESRPDEGTEVILQLP